MGDRGQPLFLFLSLTGGWVKKCKRRLAPRHEHYRHHGAGGPTRKRTCPRGLKEACGVCNGTGKARIALESGAAAR
jgi:hypothetical protein